jgi:hypothetical protein
MSIARMAVIGVLTTVSLAVADDTAVTLGAGGLIPVKSSDIAMESEDLRVSAHQITVKYLFRNTSSRDLDVVVAFPLPEIDGAALANLIFNIPSRDAVNFMDFRLSVDGKRTVPKAEIRAFFNGAEITNELRSLGLPLSALDGNVAAAMKKLAAADRSRLERDGWVDCSLTKDGKCWPYWRSRIQFYWTQRFAAGTTVEVEHVYRPVVGGGGVYGDGAANVKPYCGGSDALEQIMRQKELRARRGKDPDQPALVERQIDFILTTATNWKGPIHSFQLSVVADNPEDTVVTCMPGLRRVAPNRYELVRSDFCPDRDFRVLILQVAK